MDARIVAIIAIVIGLILCFAGFKIQKLVITLAWFAVGYALTEKLLGGFIEAKNTLLIIQIVVGVILGSMSYKLEKLALCIAVAYLSFETVGTFVVGLNLGLNEIMTFAVQLGAAILLGILSTLFIKPILIGVTGLAGAAVVQDYLPTLINLDATILTIVVIVIAVLGIVTQLKTS